METEIRGIQYFVDIHGSGPPLLLLHGFTGSHKTWEPFIPVFSKKYQTITVDLIGHGNTEAPTHPDRYAIEQAADDLIELLSHLNIEKTHVLGYSMGGRLGLMLACRHPSRIQSLILESCSPDLKTEHDRKERIESDEKLARFLEQNGIEAFIDYWEDIPLFQTQKRVRLEDRATLRHIRTQHQVVGLANSLRGMGAGQQPSLWSKLPSLPMPVLLIAGALDKKYVAIAHEMSELLKQSEKVIVEDAGHTVHFEKKEAFIEVTTHFLQQFKEASFNDNPMGKNKRL